MILDEQETKSRQATPLRQVLYRVCTDLSPAEPAPLHFRKRLCLPVCRSGRAIVTSSVSAQLAAAPRIHNT
jgi:hypothetical protein